MVMLSRLGGIAIGETAMRDRALCGDMIAVKATNSTVYARAPIGYFQIGEPLRIAVIHRNASIWVNERVMIRSW